MTATKQLKLALLPRVLVIQLKRFGEGGPRRRKITNHVQFGTTLTGLRNFVVEDAQGQVRRHEYRLRAVLVHHGRSMHSGHYFCFVLDDYSDTEQPRWLMCDDSQVKMVSLQEVLKQEAYMLFYERGAQPRDKAAASSPNAFAASSASANASASASASASTSTHAAWSKRAVGCSRGPGRSAHGPQVQIGPQRPPQSFIGPALPPDMQSQRSSRAAAPTTNGAATTNGHVGAAHALNGAGGVHPQPAPPVPDAALAPPPPVRDAALAEPSAQHQAAMELEDATSSESAQVVSDFGTHMDESEEDPGGGWICGVCRFANGDLVNECEQCEAKRPTMDESEYDGDPMDDRGQVDSVAAAVDATAGASRGAVGVGAAPVVSSDSGNGVNSSGRHVGDKHDDDDFDAQFGDGHVLFALTGEGLPMGEGLPTGDGQTPAQPPRSLVQPPQTATETLSRQQHPWITTATPLGAGRASVEPSPPAALTPSAAEAPVSKPRQQVPPREPRSPEQRHHNESRSSPRRSRRRSQSRDRAHEDRNGSSCVLRVCGDLAPPMSSPLQCLPLSSLSCGD